MKATIARFFVFSAVLHLALLSLVFHAVTPPLVQTQMTAPMMLSLLDAPPATLAQNRVSTPPAAHRKTDTPTPSRAIPAMTPARLAHSDAPAPPETDVMNEAAPRLNADVATTFDASSTARDASAEADHTVQADDSLAQQLVSRVRDALGAYFSYPPLAKRQGWQGEVKVGLRVYADGRLSDIHLVASSGYGILVRDALRSLAQVQHLDGGAGWLDGGHFDMVLPIQYRLIDGRYVWDTASQNSTRASRPSATSTSSTARSASCSLTHCRRRCAHRSSAYNTTCSRSAASSASPVTT